MTTLSQSDLAPDYDRSRITTGIVHMGVGGFHRAHQAAYLAAPHEVVEVGGLVGAARHWTGGSAAWA